MVRRRLFQSVAVILTTTAPGLEKIARVQNGTGTGQARVTVTYYSRDEDVSNANHAFWMRTLLCEAKSSTRA